MRSSCQPRALILDARVQGTRQIGHPCPVAGGTRPTTMDGLVSTEPRMVGGDLVFRPVDESGLKPSLATTIAKASERVIVDPLA
jgi:hypothetical protein